MNKQKFIELVDHPSRICEKDAEILAELARNYPYSPLVHTMLAKALQKSQEAKSSLATAAIYISDRSVLKEVMEDHSGKQADSEVTPLAVDDSIAAKNSESTAQETTTLKPFPDAVPEKEKVEVKSNVLQELEENLRELKEQRDRFDNPSKEEIKLEEIKEQEEVQNFDHEKENQPAIEPSSINRLGTLPEPLQELLRNKEEKEINDPKRIEQINLIDNFIKNSSAISRKYRSADDMNSEQNDLTSGYAFTPPDLATENLAQIMVRQGKTDKAIDIYEKLILKYPEKKAYFASCIEKLKTT